MNLSVVDKITFEHEMISGIKNTLRSELLTRYFIIACIALISQRGCEVQFPRFSNDASLTNF